MFKNSYYADVFLNQWTGLTPPQFVEAHQRLDKQVMAALRKGKATLVPASCAPAVCDQRSLTLPRPANSRQ